MLNSKNEEASEKPNESRDIFTDLLPPSMRAHLKTPVPDPLWHYTSMGAMHAILDRAEIYATDARFLNDREELIHAVGLCR
jgi:hypothetical protein